MSMTKDEILKIRRERRGQVLNIGDHVIAHAASENPLYDGKVATIIEKGISGNEVYYGLYIEGVTIEKRTKTVIGRESEIIGNTSLLAPFFAEDLELVDKLQPAEDKEKSAQSRLVDTESPYTMMAILREEEEKRKEKNYRMELAAKIAIAYAERGHYEPWEIGAKAVEVADGVVEQLKNSKI